MTLFINTKNIMKSCVYVHVATKLQQILFTFLFHSFSWQVTVSKSANTHMLRLGKKLKPFQQTTIYRGAAVSASWTHTNYATTWTITEAKKIIIPNLLLPIGYLSVGIDRL